MGFFCKLSTLFRIWNTKNLISNIKFMMLHNPNEFMDEILENCVFELDELKDMLLPLKPKVLNREESLEMLRTAPKSFARFGDGEIAIMQGKSILFQDYDSMLAEKMLKVLKTKRDDLYVGINDNYFHAIPLNASGLSRNFLRGAGPGLRKFFLREINPEIQYLNAACFTGYYHYRYEMYDEIISIKRKLFEGKKIALVTGESVKAKWDYDIFELAASKQYITAPSKNAFQEYDSILDEINRSVSKDTLICLILGPTAKVMAADLTDMGYMAWDVGHIAKDYDFYMHKKATGNEKETQAQFWCPD